MASMLCSRNARAPFPWLVCGASLLALLFCVLPLQALQLPAPPALAADAPAPGIALASWRGGISPLPKASALGDRAFILCWHTFLGVPSLDTDFSKAEAGAQLDALLALGYRFVDLEDALAGRIEGRLNLVATMDDGHRSVPDGVEAVFLPRGIRPALFVYPAIIGSIPSAMDDAALHRLQQSGCAVGAHGYHHLFVTQELWEKDREEFKKEIYKAKDKTEALSRLPVLMYAYPYGAYSPVTITEVKKAGYAWGLTAGRGFVYAEEALNSPFEIPRIVVTRASWKDIYSFLERNAQSAEDSGK